MGVGIVLTPAAQRRTCTRIEIQCVTSSQRHTSAHICAAKMKKKKRSQSRDSSSEAMIVSLCSDGSDAWKLDSVADMISDGAVGVLPTDTYPALVCDVENKNAVETLYALKRANPRKSMSILVRHMADIAEYTQGFPVSRQPGQPDFYKIAKKILPGPYTLILPASKSLPKQIIDFDMGKKQKRSTVGVRLVDNIVCQELLQRLDRPLLCSSAILPDTNEGNEVCIPDVGTMSDYYGPSLSFIVHVEDDHEQQQQNEPSTVIDLTQGEIEVIRYGKGDLSWLR